MVSWVFPKGLEIRVRYRTMLVRAPADLVCTAREMMYEFRLCFPPKAFVSHSPLNPKSLLCLLSEVHSNPQLQCFLTNHSDSKLLKMVTEGSTPQPGSLCLLQQMLPLAKPGTQESQGLLRKGLRQFFSILKLIINVQFQHLELFLLQVSQVIIFPRSISKY